MVEEAVVSSGDSIHWKWFRGDFDWLNFLFFIWVVSLLAVSLDLELQTITYSITPYTFVGEFIKNWQLHSIHGILIAWMPFDARSEFISVYSRPWLLYFWCFINQSTCLQIQCFIKLYAAHSFRLACLDYCQNKRELLCDRFLLFWLRILLNGRVIFVARKPEKNPHHLSAEKNWSLKSLVEMKASKSFQESVQLARDAFSNHFTDIVRCASFTSIFALIIFRCELWAVIIIHWFKIIFGLTE